MICYLVMVAEFFLSFCWYVYFMFGSKTELLRTMGDAYIFCLHITFADLRDVGKIVNMNEDAAVIFLLPFTFITLIFWGTMFTAIIMSAYMDASDALQDYK